MTAKKIEHGLKLARIAAPNSRTWKELAKKSGLSETTLRKHGFRPGRGAGSAAASATASAPQVDLTAAPPTSSPVAHVAFKDPSWGELPWETRQQRIVESLCPNSAVSEYGPVVTSQSEFDELEEASGMFFNAIADPAREAMAVCEALMSQRSLGERLEQQGRNDRDIWQDGGPTGPKQQVANDELAYLEKDLIDEILETTWQRIRLLPFHRVQRAEFPVDESAGWEAQTLLCDADADIDEHGRRGIRLHMAGFEQYDSRYGGKQDWCETSVFYTFPDADAVIAHVQAGAKAA